MQYVAPILAAVTASAAFSDVPAGHWAEKAVTEVAIQHGFMRGYPDRTFRGPKPFTRTQLALAMDPFIDELEALSRVRWEPGTPVRPAFNEPWPNDDVRRAVDRVANRYHLFDGILTGRTFDGNRQVTRYEMASLIDRLLLLGEAKHVVDATVLSPRHFAFTDVAQTAYPHDLVTDVADKYQVMVGFPNQTFRGPEKLTRYQFAAAAAQTFPLIKQLVIKTQEKLNPPSPAPTPRPTPRTTPVPTPAPARFLEGTPIQVGDLARFNNLVSEGAQARLLGYEGNWFWLLQTRLGVGLCTTEVAYDGDLAAGYAFQLAPDLALEPYVGGRLLDVNPRMAFGGTYGAILYHRLQPQWAWYAQAHGTTAFQGLPMGGTWLGGVLGVEYRITPALNTYLEAGWSQWPRTVNAAAGTPFDVDSAVTGSVGVSFGL